MARQQLIQHRYRCKISHIFARLANRPIKCVDAVIFAEHLSGRTLSVFEAFANWTR